MIRFLFKAKQIKRKLLSTVSKWRNRAMRRLHARVRMRTVRRAHAVSVRIAGSLSKSMVIAARDVVLQPGVGGLSVIGGALAIMIFVVVAMSNGAHSATGPAHFVQGDDLHLDLVVLPFEAVDANANGDCVQIGRDIAGRIAQTTNEQLHRPDLQDISAAVRVWAPDQVDPLQVNAGEPYSTAVERFAAKKKAGIVLYGTLQCDARSIAVDAHMYLLASDDRDALNLLGSYTVDSLTTARSERRDSAATSILNSWVSDRANAIVLLSQAFEYYNRHTQATYLKAARLLEQAHFSNNDTRMAAITHIFIGNAYTRAAVDDCNLNIDGSYLNNAADHYKLALQNDNQSPRAYLGLGSVMNTFALLDLQTNPDQATQDPDQANAYFDKALNSPANTLREAMRWHIQLARAQYKLIEHDTAVDANPVAAAQSLKDAGVLVNQLLNWYETNGAATRSQQAVAAYAYYIAGQLQAFNFNFQDARALYTKAGQLALDSDNRLKAALALQLAQVDTTLGNVCAAAQQYQIADKYTTCQADQTPIAGMIKDFQGECARASVTPTHQP